MRLKTKWHSLPEPAAVLGKQLPHVSQLKRAHVAINYRPGTDEDAQAAAAEAESFGPASIAVAADVSKREDGTADARGRKQIWSP
jgi:hypothetical protein